MFKGHPKGLYVAFFANMGERFGFYTMMAILVLFLQAKFGLTAKDAGEVYSWFYFSIYALALVGGMIADKLQNYKGTILVGIFIMLAGYIIMGVPGMTMTITLAGLFTIAFGNGLFKGNLQAIVGQLYDDSKYSHLRDSAFSVFYMGINVGAFFAPSAASGIRNWWLSTHNLGYDSSLPALCHNLLKGSIKDLPEMQKLADKVTGTHVSDLVVFAKNYLDVFVTGYNYAFLIAAAAMLVSLIIFIIFKNVLPNKQKPAKASDSNEKKAPFPVMAVIASLAIIPASAFVIQKLFLLGSLDIPFASAMAIGLFLGFVTWILMVSTKEERPQSLVLILVFSVVIFFWMSFHQNGLTMTLFARDYTQKTVSAMTNVLFDLKTFLSLLIAIFGVVIVAGKKFQGSKKAIGAGMLVTGMILVYYFYNQFSATNVIEPEIFQQFNPIFIVFLTPVVVGFFSYLNKKNMEPSTPKKIGIGMILASLGFMVMLIGSFNLISPSALAGKPSPDQVSVYWLIGSYLILTIAELFLSPMGLSFVSKVAPVRFQGIMQGGWLLATAVGNKLLFIGSTLWMVLTISQVWAVFIVCCLISAMFIFSIMKKLERVTK